MAKVYIIVHDGTDVLVCKGGNSGYPPKARQGYHLPGGTANSSNVRQEALRELEEETGIKLAVSTVSSDFFLNGATFVVAKVPKVSALPFGPQQGNNPNDEPFTSMLALPKGSGNDPQLNIKNITDWFGPALIHANANNLLN